MQTALQTGAQGWGVLSEGLDGAQALHRARVEAKKAAAFAALVEVVQAPPATRTTVQTTRLGGEVLEVIVSGTHRIAEVISGEEFRAEIRAVPGVGQVITFFNWAHTHGKVMDIRETAKLRHLLVLPSPDKGVECWLYQAAEGKFFPHSTTQGKYGRAAMRVLAAVMVGR